MTWIQTFTGKKFDIFSPQIDAIDIIDIACSLANTCRFNGQCKHFYSVVEHSIIMMQEGEKLNVLGKRIVLLHDAAEAYMGDLPRPIKKKIPEFLEAERIIQDLIYYKFDCEVTPRFAAILKQLDDRMLATEKRDLMAEPPGDWEPLPKPFERRLSYTWQPRQAEYEFIRALTSVGLWVRNDH